MFKALMTGRSKDVLGYTLICSIAIVSLIGLYLFSADARTVSERADANRSVECRPFKEVIVWSSDYHNEKGGSVRYQTWTPKNPCPGEDCFLGSLALQTRFLYFGEGNQTGEGSIQISEPSATACENPEDAAYSRYLAYEKLQGESEKRGTYCGDNKNQDGACGVDRADELPAMCYGIKSKAAQHFIVDAYEMNYTLCGEPDE